MKSLHYLSQCRARNSVMALAVSGLVLFVAAPVLAAPITFGPSGQIQWSSPVLQLNGAASVQNTADGEVLRVVSDVQSQAGSAFFKNPYVLGLNSDFHSEFIFRITSGNPVSLRSDGLAFVIARSPTSLGGAGEGLGYSGINNSVAIEFDTYQNGFDPSGSHVAVMSDGNNADHSKGSKDTILPMDNGDRWKATVNYYGQTNYLSLILTDLDNSVSNLFLETTIDIADILGCGSAGCVNSYFGFTAATGGGFANYDILSWSNEVPEPSGIALIGLALLGVGFTQKRRLPSARPD